MIRARVLIGVTLFAVLAAGCGPDRPKSLGMPDSTFVSTLSELRRIESDTSLDITMRDSTRRIILRRHKVTSAKLEAAARILAESPTRASDLWRQVETIPRASSPKPLVKPTSAPDNNHPVQH